MLELYQGLSENDIYNGLWMLRSSNPLIKAMLSYDSFGIYSRAQDVAAEILKSNGNKTLPGTEESDAKVETKLEAKVEAKVEVKIENPVLKDEADDGKAKAEEGKVKVEEGKVKAEEIKVKIEEGKDIPTSYILDSSEIELLEKEWLKCARNLNQWDVLQNFSQNVGNVPVLIEADFRLGEWKQMRDHLPHHPHIDSGQYKLFSAYYAMYDYYNQNMKHRLATSAQPPPPVSFNEAHDLLDQAYNVTIKEWNNLPPNPSYAHLLLLDRFQKLVELNESSQLFREIITPAKGSNPKQPPDFKNIFTNWRERLPNKWDDFTIWSSLFAWRIHMFRFCVSMYSKQEFNLSTSTMNVFNCTDSQLCLLHDAPWTMIKLAGIARKQRSLVLSQVILNDTYSIEKMVFYI